MSAMWGIHNDRRGVDFVDDGAVALGWNAMPDLREIGADREAMRDAVAAAYPRAKRGAIPVWAGVLLRFAFEMQPGDLVVHPCKADATVSVGRVAADYRFAHDARALRHRRDVSWLATGVPRDAFSERARYEIGCSLTLFRIRRHDHEFRALVDDAAVAR